MRSNKAQKRINFSIIREDGRYRIKCDETSELVTGKIASKKLAMKLLRENISVASFKVAAATMPKEEVLRRVKLFGGRLRPKKKPWTIEEARLVASIYDTRGKFYNNNKKCYHSAYHKGWLNDICSHMKPSRKKNKFVFGVLNPNTALAKIFDYNCHYDFSRDNAGAYDALRRYGVDTLELFDNRDNAEYLKMVIKKLADDSLVRLTQ